MFFNASQVLPCYVIRLRFTGLGDKKAPVHHIPPLLQKYQEEVNTANDDAKRKQEKLLARVGTTHRAIICRVCLLPEKNVMYTKSVKLAVIAI